MLFPQRQLILILFLLIPNFLMPIASAGSEKFSIIEPKENSLMTGRFISLVLKINNREIDKIIISSDKKKDDIALTVPRDKELICTVLPLNFHSDDLSVSASKGGIIVESKKIKALLQTDLSRNGISIGSEFKSQPFHVKDKEAACSQCHRLKITENDLRPQNPKDSICFPCHKKITEYKNVHGPAARWECLVCHNKDSAPEKFSLHKNEKDLCFSCHDEEREQWDTKKYTHGPTATGKCSICHNPHASPHRYWLKSSIRPLCLSCHDDMAKGKKKHGLKVFSLIKDEHPTRGVRDPKNPGEKLTCTSCHNPHVSMTPTMLAYDGGSIYSFCNECHKK